MWRSSSKESPLLAGCADDLIVVVIMAAVSWGSYSGHLTNSSPLHLLLPWGGRARGTGPAFGHGRGSESLSNLPDQARGGAPWIRPPASKSLMSCLLLQVSLLWAFPPDPEGCPWLPGQPEALSTFTQGPVWDGHPPRPLPFVWHIEATSENSRQACPKHRAPRWPCWDATADGPTLPLPLQNPENRKPLAAGAPVLPLVPAPSSSCPGVGLETREGKAGVCGHQGTHGAGFCPQSWALAIA